MEEINDEMIMGTTISNKYKLIEQIGKGSFGFVLKYWIVNSAGSVLPDPVGAVTNVWFPVTTACRDHFCQSLNSKGNRRK